MGILIPRRYYRLHCHVCNLNCETVDYQYAVCPKCGSHSVTTARAERYEGYEADKRQQKDANDAIERALRKLPS